jgi:hypothetical protein
MSFDQYVLSMKLEILPENKNRPHIRLDFRANNIYIVKKNMY